MANSNKVSWINSIQTRIVLLIILITLLVLGGTTAYTAIESKKKMEADLTALASSTSSRLASHLINPLWNLDNEQVSQAVAAEMEEKRIYGIVVFDSEGNKVITAKKRNKNWKPVNTSQSSFKDADLIKTSKNVSHKSQNIGKIVSYVTPRFLNEEIKSYYINSAIQAAVIILALVVALFIALKSMVINPISKLSDAADAISLGNLEESISSNSKNEIGKVSNSMERMRLSFKIMADKLSS